MFDFAWSEIGLIAAVALIFIGPKDMPVAIRTVASMVKKARRMAAEFQTHVDEMVREANLDEVKNSFNEIRNFNFQDTVEKHIDPDGSLRNTFADDSVTSGTSPGEPVPGEHIPAEAEVVAAIEVEPAMAEPALAVPAFIPPGMIPPPEPAKAQPPEAPPFVPPQYALH